jgi:hypothetical protein
VVAHDKAGGLFLDGPNTERGYLAKATMILNMHKQSNRGATSAAARRAGIRSIVF